MFRLKLLPVVTALLTIIPVVLEAQSSFLEVRVSTNKEVYSTGEPIEISVQACNIGNEPYIVQVFDDGCPLHQLNILDENEEQVANLHNTCGWCPPGGALIELRWEPDECTTAGTTIWNQHPDVGDNCDQSGPQVPPGVYSADATGWPWDGGLAHDSAAFSIVQDLAQNPVPVSFRALMLLAFGLAAIGCWILHRTYRT